MDTRTAKSIAARLQCDFWYSREWNSWALHRLGEDSVEDSGGLWIAPAHVKDMPAHEFERMCRQVVETKEWSI